MTTDELATSVPSFADNEAASMYVRPSSALSRKLAISVVKALIDEVEVTPKPALVDRRYNGAHHDLTLLLMRQSALVLMPYFEEMASLAEGHVTDVKLRELLGSVGRRAEKAMLHATNGVNTHRGAIWTMGLLISAAASGSCNEQQLCYIAGKLAGLPDRFVSVGETHGQSVLRRYGASGAKGEAVAGFPHVLKFGLPALRAARASGASEEEARVEALLQIMTSLCDTCLLHRGGEVALAAAQQGARSVMDAGGLRNAKGFAAFAVLDETLMGLWASPGGSADLLAATLFVDALFPKRRGAKD